MISLCGPYSKMKPSKTFKLNHMVHPNMQDGLAHLGQFSAMNGLGQGILSFNPEKLMLGRISIQHTRIFI